jgi:hypothetical protein
MAKLSRQEKAWLKKAQKIISQCPDSLSDRVEAYTIGDFDICLFVKKTAYDYEKELEKRMGDVKSDRYVCNLVEESDAELARLYFPFQISATAG